MSTSRDGRIVPSEPTGPMDAALDYAFSRLAASERVRFGPFEMDICGPDPALVASLAAAFPPSRDGRREADLTVAALEGQDHAPLRAVVGAGETLKVMATPERFALWQSDPYRNLHILDRTTRRGLFWADEPVMPEWARSRPLLPLIHALAAPTAWAPVHAAAVGQDGRFLVVAGPSRSGKTTASLACARAGWAFAGDDFVLLDADTGRVEPIFVSARLRSELFEHFQDFADGVRVARTQFLGELRDELRLSRAGVAIGEGGEVAAIIFPRRLGAEAISFTPLVPAQALSGITFVTITELPGYRELVMPKLLRILKLAPLFQCDTGSDPAAIPDAFAQLLRSLPE